MGVNMEQMSRRHMLRVSTAGAIAAATPFPAGAAADDELQIRKLSTPESDLTLVRDGRVQPTIVIQKDITATKRRGARELQDHLQRMSGAGLTIAGDAAGNVEIFSVFHFSPSIFHPSFSTISARQCRTRTEVGRAYLSDEIACRAVALHSTI
jgi:hypothetical protein